MTRRPAIAYAVAVGAVIAACVVGSAIYSGADGAISALIAGAIVTVFFASTPLVLRPIMRVSPNASLLSALIFFVTKVIALLALVTVLLDERTIGTVINRPSLGATITVTAIAWTILLVVRERRGRTPVYDLDDDGNPHP